MPQYSVAYIEKETGIYPADLHSVLRWLVSYDTYIRCNSPTCFIWYIHSVLQSDLFHMIHTLGVTVPLVSHDTYIRCYSPTCFIWYIHSVLQSDLFHMILTFGVTVRLVSYDTYIRCYSPTCFIWYIHSV